MAYRKVPDRFLVAFSFAGEQRELVRSIADSVEGILGSETVFFDEWYEHYLAGVDADLKLQDIYGDRCALAVVCISQHYGGKPWTLSEYEAIRARLMQARASDDPRARDGILPIQVGEGDVPGVSFNTIVPDVRERAPRDTAQLIVDRLRMLVPENALLADQVTYSGDGISVNFSDIEVRAILQLLADFTGLNFVLSDTVRGNIPLRLNNVPWDQVLDIILEQKGLAMRQTGNIIKIAPLVELAAMEKLELEMQQQIDELQPLHTEFIAVRHARAAELASLLSSARLGVLSERGVLVADERTNTLIARDVQPFLDAIHRIVGRLDVPVE